MREEYDRIGIKRNWPEYEVIEILGAGAYGKVYKIRRDYLGDTIFSAVKVIHVPSSDSITYTLKSEGMTQSEIEEYYGNQAESFLKENRLMQQLKGAANIVTTEDCVVEKDVEGPGYTMYIKMELLESFENLMANYDLGPDDIVKIGCDICDALIVCEQKHIVHRDIKPANIFINEFGTFKLGDFGVARQTSHTQTNMTQIGTMNYMAPELYGTGKADHRVDIYSLGIMLYRLGNGGKFPFLEGGTTRPEVRQEALIKRLQGTPLPMPKSVDAELGKIILKACAYRAEDRYASANDFKRALEKWKYKQEFMREILEEEGIERNVVKYEEPPVVQQNPLELEKRQIEVEPYYNKKQSEEILVLKNAQIGDLVTFGSYQQDNISNQKEKIQWRVLDQKDGKLLLLSEKALDCQPYNKSWESVTWENCTLREWLNNEFYNIAFDDNEKTVIQMSEVIMNNNPYYRTDEENNTWDRIFLLSIEEAKKYFKKDNDRRCEATKYAKVQGAYINKGLWQMFSRKKESCWWWLRSPGNDASSAAGVDTVGSVSIYGYNVHVDSFGVRPALWINP